jgi:ATP-dependent 26S proteasome regulatory subunit
MSFLTYVKAGFPLLWIKSHEEQRVLTECTRLLNARTGNGSIQYRAFDWNIADGIRPLVLRDNDIQPSDPIEGTSTDPFAPLVWLDEKADENTVLFLNDYHSFLAKEFPDITLLTRKIKNLSVKFKAQGKTLVFISAGCTIPMELEKDMTRIDYKLPGREELRAVLHELCAGLEAPYPRQDEPVIDAAIGMTTVEAENAYAAVYQESHRFDPALIVKEKAAIVKKSGLLEVIETSETMEDIGGLEVMKEWLTARSECFSDKARRFGVEPPKGMLLIGVPGSGKSLAIKAVASIWNRPCLRLDMGRIFGSLVGESENNMQSVLDIAAASSPCVLWMDEIEKGLSGNQSGHESHETTRRVFQLLLTWMQEKKSDVFVAATANSVSSLPPELLRAGRIDVKFWVDLPDAVQRQDILKIHLRKRGRDIANYQDDIVRLVDACDKFTGAEIESWVKEALVRAYHEKHEELMTEDLLATVGDIIPISRLAAEEIDRSRAWARDHGVKSASVAHASTAEPVKRVRRVVQTT